MNEALRRPGLLQRWTGLICPGPVGAVLPVVALSLALNGALRLVLAAVNGDPGVFLPWRILPAVAIGTLFDLGVAIMAVAPLALVIALWPARWRRGLRITLAVLLLPAMLGAVFAAGAEITFWNEFASRFNFIAVEYLVYSREVLGNIRESYDLGLLLPAVGAVALALWLLLVRAMRAPLARPFPPWRRRLAALAAWIVLPVIAYAALDARYKEFSPNAQLNELAGNGYFDFAHAFWANEIDYDRFYAVLPEAVAHHRLARRLKSGAPAGALPFEREVRSNGPERPLNVVLVTMESLSAEFMAAFGNAEGLTPNLDRIAREGMLFTRLYATGTRTVRGLEAVTLSVPPTPGHSIVKRPDNAGLFTIGEVFRQKGYERLYLYGGYSYFDNMAAFYGGNDYTVIDRTALSSKDIHVETIWGVADEDLFAMALRELDARHAQGRKVYAHVMTTSNHRPYIYPEGRIDLAPKTSGRNGGVKYTDWAVGRFVDEARKKPWFDSTLFVILADHTHKGRGLQELPLENYHIPMIVYAPKHVAPGEVATLASQIDVAPTVLGLLDFGYRSRFFGHDILREGRDHPRALMANYQTVGYHADGITVELKPGGRTRIVEAATGRERAVDETTRPLLEEAIAYYQTAARAYRQGRLKLGAGTGLASRHP
ncbi:MAG TPA: sulfatase-like hydrolase/transferase [Microvirga sp.]|jgi:phosphoglycerol transferase MdoB-like AlkP superfamily enzyme|nr:sulfatase-like hydrolase/transferase [Microvirga sp.]